MLVLACIGNYGHHLGAAIGLGYMHCELGEDVLASSYEIEVAGEVQFLMGALLNRAGRVVFKGVEFQGPDRDELFVLSSEWNCQLYRGLMPWPLEQD